MNTINLGFWSLLLERDFLVTMFVAIASFALANAVAAIPARIAARTATAVLLRSE